MKTLLLYLVRAYYQILLHIKGKIPYKDKYGLKYFLWQETRWLATVLYAKVRTDDSGVIETIKLLVYILNNSTDDKAITCVDVGAYIGVISLSMSKFVSDKGSIIFSFEPHSRNYSRLLENIIYNDSQNIIPCKIALSDSVGTASISNSVNSGGESIMTNSNSDIIRTSEKCVMTTLDTFCSALGISNIDILKIDAEGVDDRVLLGGKKLLENQSIDYIIVEFHQDSECSKHVVEILTDNNYAVYYIVRNGDYIVMDLEKYPSDAYKPALNLLAISNNANTKGKVIDTLYERTSRQ